jgi:hypothetical protein
MIYYNYLAKRRVLLNTHKFKKVSKIGQNAFVKAAAMIADAIARICKLDRTRTRICRNKVLHMWKPPSVALSLFMEKDSKNCFWRGDSQVAANLQLYLCKKLYAFYYKHRNHSFIIFSRFVSFQRLNSLLRTLFMYGFTALSHIFCFQLCTKVTFSTTCVLYDFVHNFS